MRRGFQWMLTGALVLLPGLMQASVRYQTKPLAEQVRHQLAMLPYYGVFDNLAYNVQGDRVTLSGQVVWASLKQDAERAVRSVPGVEEVKNDIQVLPLSPFDDRLRWAIARAVYGDAALNRYALGAQPPIHIIVDNGHVTLEGVVANQMDKNLAGLRANGVAGVFSVVNHLRVDG